MASVVSDQRRSSLMEGDMVRVASSPGEVLREEYLVPYGMSANALAAALHVPANRITAILNGTRSVTAATALRLARYFDTSPEFWMALQVNHELSKVQAEIGEQVMKEVRQRRSAG